MEKKVKKSSTFRTFLFQGILYLSFFLLTLLLLIPTLVFTIQRIFIMIVFWKFSRKKYTLMHYLDAAFSVSSSESVCNILTFYYIKGDSCDLTQLQERVSSILEKKEGRIAPYERFYSKPVIKFGYFCWEDVKDKFDIEEHVKFFPGMDNVDKCYSEREFLDSAGKYSDKMWDEDKPNWEIVVVPRIMREDGSTNYVFMVKYLHGYGDGLTGARFLDQIFNDGKSFPGRFDLVNPPLPKVPFWSKLIFDIYTTALVPYHLMRILVNREESDIFQRGQVAARKFVGRSSNNIRIEVVKEIRNWSGASFTAIFNSAVVGALRKMAVKKGFLIPDTILGVSPVPMLPYPNYGFQNRFSIFVEPFPVRMSDALQRVQKTGQILKRTSRILATLKASNLQNAVIGRCPAAVARWTISRVNFSFVLSNVPSVMGTRMYNGDLIEMYFGFPPQLNYAGCSIGTIICNERLIGGILVEKTKLVSSVEEVDELMGNFEREILLLYKQARNENDNGLSYLDD